MEPKDIVEDSGDLFEEAIVNNAHWYLEPV